MLACGSNFQEVFGIIAKHQLWREKLPGSTSNIRRGLRRRGIVDVRLNSSKPWMYPPMEETPIINSVFPFCSVQYSFIFLLFF